MAKKKDEEIITKEVPEQYTKLMYAVEWAKCKGHSIYDGSFVKSVNKKLMTEMEYDKLLEQTKNERFDECTKNVKG